MIRAARAEHAVDVLFARCHLWILGCALTGRGGARDIGPRTDPRCAVDLATALVTDASALAGQPAAASMLDPQNLSLFFW